MENAKRPSESPTSLRWEVVIVNCRLGTSFAYAGKLRERPFQLNRDDTCVEEAYELDLLSFSTVLPSGGTRDGDTKYSVSPKLLKWFGSIALAAEPARAVYSPR